MMNGPGPRPPRAVRHARPPGQEPSLPTPDLAARRAAFRLALLDGLPHGARSLPALAAVRDRLSDALAAGLAPPDDRAVEATALTEAYETLVAEFSDSR